MIEQLDAQESKEVTRVSKAVHGRTRSGRRFRTFLFDLGNQTFII